MHHRPAVSIERAGLMILFAASAAQATTLFVRDTAPAGGNGQSWATAHGRLFDALDAAAANPAVDQIWVATGVYKPARNGTNRGDSFTLVSGVRVYGGFAGTETLLSQRNPAVNVTTLSGDLQGNDGPGFVNRADNSRHVVRATGLTGGLLDGFTIKGGNEDSPGNSLTGGGGVHLLLSTFDVARCFFTDNIAGGTAPDIGGFGAGLLVQACPVAHVSGCRFENNRGMAGGGMAIWDEESDRTHHTIVATVTGCDFVNNFSPSQTAGAIWSVSGDQLNLTTQGEITATGCLFENNHAEYYGAWLDQNTTRLTIDSCVFRGNSALVAGGALGCIQTVGPDTPTPVMVRRSVFENNSCPSHGSAVVFEARNAAMDWCTLRGNVGSAAVEAAPLIGIAGGSRSLDLRNCLVHDNTGTGVFGFQNPRLSVLNSTVAPNVSGISGGLAGGIETSAGVVLVHNSVLWGNTRGGVADEAAQIRSFTSAPSVQFSVVQGLTGALGGAGNMGADPLFANAPSGDFRLLGGSPAIDAGSNPLTPATTTTDLDGHARFVDDPAAANTGVGPGPIVDIGAYERALPACPGDTNGDRVIDFADLNTVLSQFGQAGPPGSLGGDVTGDGVVNFADLNLVLSHFGEAC